MGGSTEIEVTYATSYQSSVVTFFQKQETDDTVEIKRHTNSVEKLITYSALTNFKRAIFQCEECKDTDNDGRIDYMKFVEINTLEEDIDMR